MGTHNTPDYKERLKLRLERLESSIPKELQERLQWVMWKAVPDEKTGKMDKVPKQINGEGASHSDPITWTSFQAVLSTYRDKPNDFSGVGYVFSKSYPYCGIDLDNCVNEDGQIEEWAMDWIERFNSYTEWSPSGKGLHIICSGDLGERSGKHTKIKGTDHDVGIFDTTRYFTFTGDLLKDSPSNINAAQEQVDTLYSSLKETGGNQIPPGKGFDENFGMKKEAQYVAPSIDAILERTQSASNAGKIQALMSGDLGDHPSQSEADMALCYHLAFYTVDAEQIYEIVKTTELYLSDERDRGRRKWDRSGYVASTIGKALYGVKEHYNWGSIPIVAESGDSSVPGAVSKIIQNTCPVFNVKEHMPPPGLLRDYVTYMKPMTEAPAQYHLFAGLVMISTTIGQCVYFEIADSKKYCNLWAVLIGRSGIKKSTSINKPRSLLINCDLKDRIFPTQVTSEKLIPMLAERPVGTFFWSEWGATMDQWGKSYTQDTMSIFTDLYDGGYFSRWLKAEKYEIENSSISLLCGCTHSWLRKTIDQGDVAMGYWPRFLFVPAARRDRYLPNPPKGNKELRESIEAKIKELTDRIPKEYPQEADFQKVEQLYADWYETNNRQADADTAPSYMAAFIVRLSDYVKKLAILVEVSSADFIDQETTAVSISEQSMLYAMKLADWLKKAITYVMAETKKTEDIEREEHIYKLIKEAGSEGLPHRDLRHKLSYSREEVERATASLEDSERIRIVQIKARRGPGRPGKVYFLRL